MTAPVPKSPRSWTGRIFRIVGFLAGLALIVWCAERAFADHGATETWTKLGEAPEWALWGLGLTSLGSLLVNSVMFWCLVRPVRPIGLGEMTGVNLVASMLNYLPVPLRLGMFARIAYHVRVNRMGAVAVAGYFGAVVLVTLLVFGGLAVAIAMFPLGGAGLAAGAGLASLAAGAMLVGTVARWKFLAVRTRDAERVLSDRKAIAGGIAMRTADTLLWSARMVCAVTVLELDLSAGESAILDLSAGESAILGLVAVAMSMNPLGRFGFREAGVVWASGFLFAGRMEANELEQTIARLAIVESAAEGAVTLPLGAVMLPWFLGRMRKAPPRDDLSPRPADGPAETVVQREVMKA